MPHWLDGSDGRGRIRHGDGVKLRIVLGLAILAWAVLPIPTASAQATTTAVPVRNFGRLVIAKIAVDVVISEDVNASSLAAGVGHYPHTPAPGDLGNAGLAGHRGVAPAPFARLKELTPGDEVRVQRTDAGDVVFKVDSVAVLPASDPAILAPATVPVLTMTAAEGDGANQIVVRAVLAGDPSTGSTLAPLAPTPSTSRPPRTVAEGDTGPGQSVFYGALILVVVGSGIVGVIRRRR